MSVKIGNILIPPSMNNRALNYLWEPGDIVARNGVGDAIVAGGARVTWTWAVLDLTEYQYLVTTLLAGAASKEFTGAANTVLYNDQHNEISYSHAVVLRPQYKLFGGSFFREVTLMIDCLY